MTDEKDPIYVRYVKLTPKGQDLIDRLMKFLEDNVDIAAKGLDEIVEKMAEEGEFQSSKVSQSPTSTAKTEIKR